MPSLWVDGYTPGHHVREANGAEVRRLVESIYCDCPKRKSQYLVVCSLTKPIVGRTMPFALKVTTPESSQLSEPGQLVWVPITTKILKTHPQGSGWRLALV